MSHDDFSQIDPATAGSPYYCGMVVVDTNTKPYRFLVIRVIPQRGRDAGHKLAKFPGGMQSRKDSANPLRTGWRELGEETGLCMRPGLAEDPVPLPTVKDGEHLKYFYIVLREWLSGELIAGIKRDGNDFVISREWMSFPDLKEKLFPPHQVLLPRLEEWLEQHEARR